jgi:hypothetical protein
MLTLPIMPQGFPRFKAELPQTDQIAGTSTDTGLPGYRATRKANDLKSPRRSAALRDFVEVPPQRCATGGGGTT